MSTWEEADRQAADAEWIRLENDGDSARLLILEPPEVRMSEYRGRERKQMVFVTWSDGQIRSWSVGTRLYRRIAEQRDRYSTHALQVIRSGAKGSTDTTYRLSLLPMTEEELGVRDNWAGVAASAGDVSVPSDASGDEIPF